MESLPQSEGNHFNLLRIIAASAVIVSHSYSLSLGRGTVEPLESFAGFTLGTSAVMAFFAISGYFIMLSFARRKSNLGFAMARASRILPACSSSLLSPPLSLGRFSRRLPISASW